MKTKLLMMAAALLFSATAYAQDVQPASGDIESASTNCTYNFGSGDLKWCLSESGNLMKFESPSGVETIRLGVLTEGYALCATGLGPYYDHADVASGWGAPVLNSISGAAATITRTTTDGRFRLVQKFTRDTAERDVTVTMTVTNLTGGAIGGIQLARAADFDHGFIFDASVRGVWSRGTHAHTLSAITMKYPATSAVHNTFHPPAGCVPTPVAGPASGDFSAFSRYDIGSLGSLKAATVKFVYRGQ